MDLIADLAADPPKGIKPEKGRHVVLVSDEDSKQKLLIENDGDLEAYDLEKASWATGAAHTDAVVVGAIDGEVVVVFIELTGSLTDELKKNKKESQAQRKLRQLAGAVAHFHPGAKGEHGTEHHEKFASGEDPVTPKPAPLHRVVAIAVAERNGSRAPTPPFRVGTAIVQRQFRTVPHPPGITPRISLRDLFTP